MYPLKFEKIFKEKVWGSRKFQQLLDMDLPLDKNIGESWEISSRKNEMSIVANGKLKGITLEMLLKEYKDKLVGKEVYDKYGEVFPLLIKYLDINDRLSVQVHPNNEYALKEKNEFGKSESWYIIDARDDAKVIMGVAEGITKEIFEYKIKNKEFDNLFNIISVKKGDFININPGLVHASLEGSMVICEIQQNSDMTYRLYDFDRLIDGIKRPLHLKEGLEVMKYELKPEIFSEEKREKKKIQDAQVQNLIRGEYFNIDKIDLFGSYKKICNNFCILSILSGFGKIDCNKQEYEFKKGDTYFIPSGLEIKISGKTEILESFL